METIHGAAWKPLAENLKVNQRADSVLRRGISLMKEQLKAQLKHKDADPKWTLSNGWAAKAIFCDFSEIYTRDDEWTQLAHSCLESCVQGLAREDNPASGLWNGVAGVLWAILVLGRGGRRYAGIEEEVSRYLAEIIGSGMDESPDGKRRRPFEYDWISGKSGLLAVLSYSGNDKLFALRDDLARAIADGVLRENGMEGLAVFPHEQADKYLANLSSGPLVNLGFAHGIGGIMTALAIFVIKTRQMQCDGDASVRVRAAILKLRDFLMAAADRDQWGICWPSAVPLDNVSGQASARDAWCYGGPGCAAAIAIASQALEDTAPVSGDKIFQDVLSRPAHRRRISNSSICHGEPGLILLISWFSNRIRQMPEQGQLIEQLIEKNIGELEAGLHSNMSSSFLEGPIGTILGLLSAVSKSYPQWMGCMGLL